MGGAIFYLIGGFILLFVSGELLVRGAVSTASALRISPLIIGLTIIAFGTSAPELTVSIQAGLAGKPDIALGNAIGSNIANLLLVLGVVALVAPIAGKAETLRRDGLIMLGLSFGFLLVLQFDEISRPIGLAMLAILCLYSYALYHMEKGKGEAHAIQSDMQDERLPGGLWLGVPALLVGIAGVIWGAQILLDGAVNLARLFHISEAVIGLSLVAVGTSLPELAVSLIAALRGHAAVALGNIIGSNIANILLIIGTTASITPLAIAAQFRLQDIWVMLGATVLMLWFLRSHMRISRGEGALLLLFYSGYGFWLFQRG